MNESKCFDIQRRKLVSNMYVCVQSFPITLYKFFKTILVFVHLQLDKKIYSYISDITFVLEKNEGGERKALLL